ncbi:tryptophan halogenase family protein [Aliiglaciecola lipolytica]|uniref:Tryptophan halogenase n=1 Tax=Aliiglaciecola lipolytica E3 TaxID=1127673 RepID=K6X7J4_9ALTE|nr:tryptophan halogenase family protein [Aliiglaciecola lipolytica]GAC16594.1 tryptophan halogenase [Aliiglaciecola lipolytica E3]
MTNSVHTHQPKKLLIVGGGSAGWITALYLHKYFNQQGQHLDISLIESDHIGPIGVGEATVHSIRFLFAALGLDEAELMRDTNATLKSGILFRNWMKPVNGKTHEYFHPFEQQRHSGNLDISSEWILGEHYLHQRYDQGTCASSAFLEGMQCPKAPMSHPYQGLVPYGYHLDATLLGQFLQKKGLEAGIKRVVDTIEVVHVEDGEISSVSSKSTTYEADFYIDCSGFRGKLIEALAEDNWISFEDELPCNKAVAIQREYLPGEVPKPYTTATALSHGWAWQIDLVNRQGTGYVYDGKRLSKDQAEQELRALLGDAVTTKDALHLDMKVGCRKAFWVGNCLSVGLSAGFIEPLESTGLHLINLGARLFATHFTAGQCNQTIRDSYNRQLSGIYDDLKQFIVLHYCLTDRDDSAFWQQAQRSADNNPQLTEKLQIWKHKICEFMDLAGGFTTTFSDENYRYVLYGMQHFPSLHACIDKQQNHTLFSQLKKHSDNLMRQSSSHQAFLERLHQRPLFERQETKNER